MLKVRELIKDCFVTGKWKSGEDASELLRLDDMSDNDDKMFGDFEDLETGEKKSKRGKLQNESDAGSSGDENEGN